MTENPARHNTHRELEILRQLRLSGGSCRIEFLASRMGVSKQTVRRNVHSLEHAGAVRKVHGGVHLLNMQTEESFQVRMDVNPQAKRQIAASVADIIEDGDSLFLDIGSTTAYVAMALQNHRELFVVTNSVSVAHSLATRNNNRVVLAGGELRSHDGGSFGTQVIDFISQFNIRYAVLSAGAISESTGFMLHDLQEAEVSRAAMARASTKIVVSDSSKFGISAPITLTRPDDIDMLITERPPHNAIARLLRTSDVDVVISGLSQS